MRALQDPRPDGMGIGMNVGRRIAGLAIGLAALFVLTSCLDQSPNSDSDPASSATDNHTSETEPATSQANETDDGGSSGTEQGPTQRLDGAQGTTPTQPGDGQWMMAGETFTFNLALCMISDEDILLHGPGTEDQSGEPGYLDVDLVALDGVMYGEARVDLGVTEQFDSSDRFYVIRVGAEESSVLDLQERAFQLDGDVFFSDGNHLGLATLSIDCRA